MSEPKTITKQEQNRMICDLLIAGIERFPDLRFGQLLRYFEITRDKLDDKGNVIGWQDDFSTPSSEILARISNYNQVMKDLGAYVDNNTVMAIRRLKLDKRNRKTEASRD